MVELTTEFLDLNDYCLEHVFNFCDVQTIVSVSKVCKRINAVVTKIHFPRQTELLYSGFSGVGEKQFLDILSHIGMYLVDLGIGHTRWNNNGPNINLYQSIGRLVGDRIRKLSISELEMTHDSLQAIGPVLERLEELELSISEDLNFIDLRSLCPKLRRLNFYWNTPFSLNLDNWPFLEELTFFNDFIVLEEFQEFMQNNPQLRKFKLGWLGCEVRLQDVAQHLVNLEHLVISQFYSDFTPGSILELQPLTHLKRLTLCNLRSGFEGFINNATKLNGLTELQIQGYIDADDYCDPNQESIVRIALQMPQLQVFGISYCRLEYETILKFLQFADNLREIHIHHCIHYELTQGTIEDIINARNKNRNRIDPLVVYVDRINENLLEVIYLIAGECIELKC